MKTELQKKVAQLLKQASKRKPLTTETVGQDVAARDRFKALDKLPAIKLPRGVTSLKLIEEARAAREEKPTAKVPAKRMARKPGTAMKPVRKPVAKAARPLKPARKRHPEHATA